MITICICKLFISTFLTCVWMSTRQSTGVSLADIVTPHLGDGLAFFAVVADNVKQHHAMFAIIIRRFPWLFCLGCFVHVLDLLIEDIAKIPAIARLGKRMPSSLLFSSRSIRSLSNSSSFFSIQAWCLSCSRHLPVDTVRLPLPDGEPGSCQLVCYQPAH